jgi:hypothetical protein
MFRPIYRLLDWIDPNKLDWTELSTNPKIIYYKFLEENLDKINWRILSSNPHAIHILEKHLDKV